MEGIFKLQEKIAGVRHPFPQSKGRFVPRRKKEADAHGA
jgi:hypothetical protein